MKIVVAVTAASGALYARLCLEQLLRAEEVSEIALVYSTHASEVADFEGVTMPEDPVSYTHLTLPTTPYV